MQYGLKLEVGFSHSRHPNRPQELRPPRPFLLHFVPASVAHAEAICSLKPPLLWHFCWIQEKSFNFPALCASGVPGTSQVRIKYTLCINNQIYLTTVLFFISSTHLHVLSLDIIYYTGQRECPGARRLWGNKWRFLNRKTDFWWEESLWGSRSHKLSIQLPENSPEAHAFSSWVIKKCLHSPETSWTP